VGTGAIKKREEINSEYKWKLEDIYANENIWEQDYQEVKTLTQEIQGYQGSLTSASANLLKVLQLNDELGRKSEKLYVYSRMRRDENNANHQYQAMFSSRRMRE